MNFVFIKKDKNVLTIFVSIEQMRNVGDERRGAKGYTFVAKLIIPLIFWNKFFGFDGM